MENIKVYVDKIKDWSGKNPKKFIFLLGLILGFITGSII
jgi:hypothetical protein